MDKTVSSTTLDLQALNQDAAIDQTAIDSGHNTSTDNVNPTSQYASGLMDELFEEVDGILDGSLIPPSEPLKVAPPEEPKAPINLDFAAFLSTPSAERAAMMADLGLHNTSPSTVPQNHEIVPTATANNPVQIQVRRESYGVFEKMLLFVGCSSSIVAMTIWLGSQGTIARMVTALKGGSETAVVVAKANPTDAKFADYMGRSLEAIDSKTKNSSDSSTTLPTELSPSETMGTVKVPTSPMIVLGGSGLPKPNAPTISSKPNITPNGATIVPAPIVTPQNTLEQTVAKLSNLVDRMSRNASAPIAIAPAIPNSIPAPIAQAPAAPTRILKGILGNGDRSAVMFELNGITTNYEKGEKIGNSGWVLVGVDNGNAVIRRNGEVRTLSVGQHI